MNKLWAISMFRDEADVAAEVTNHLYALGVEGITILDNRSVDGTGDILRDCGVEVIDDPKVAYLQDQKMTSLAHTVWSQHQPEWIIPFDADELWCPLEGNFVDLTDTDASVIEAATYNHFCTGLDEPGHPFEAMTWKWSSAFGAKVMFKYDPSVHVGFGNHTVRVQDRRMETGTLQLRHFPFRGTEHFRRKIINGAEAIRAGGPKVAWLNYIGAYEEKGPEGLDEIFYQWFHYEDPHEGPFPGDWPGGELIHDPAPLEPQVMG